MEKERLRVISRRGSIMLLIMLVFVGWVVFELFSMQVNKYQYYQSKVIDNIQQEYTINAERGQIYDANMTPLAVNITTYRIFLDPVAIQNGSSSRDGEETAGIIADGLAEILGVDRESVYKKAMRKGSKDETIKRRVEEKAAEEPLLLNTDFRGRYILKQHL